MIDLDDQKWLRTYLADTGRDHYNMHDEKEKLEYDEYRDLMLDGSWEDVLEEFRDAFNIPAGHEQEAIEMLREDEDE
jgi:hypothetical protein